jgi:hypothetical protein
MDWELDALKMLAKNQTVPGIALKDAIKEIEHLQNELKKSERRCRILFRRYGTRNTR